MFPEKMSTVDVLIAIPLIPLLPVVVTWWLPWERWLPGKIPKRVLGPYFLYAFFAAWHFSMPWWVLLTVALWGVILTVMAMVQEFEKKGS
jgi:RsiW-degrading membrane proteinase PrsW (M82 family)